MSAPIVCGVVMYETPQSDLRRLVNSIRTAADLAGVAVTLLAIDNSGREGKATFAKIIADALPADLLPHDGNLGFGPAHNRMMARAFAENASHYLALHPDGFLHPEALRALLAQCAAHDDFALVEARQFPNEHPKIYDPATLKTPWCAAACLMIPQRLHREIGGFDDGFFMYCEDVDYSWRARADGAACVLAGDAFFFRDVRRRPQNPVARWHMALSMKRLLSRWMTGAPPLRLTKLLTDMLSDVSDDAVRTGSKPGASLPEAPNPDIADFTHFFGFAPFRWS